MRSKMQVEEFVTPGPHGGRGSAITRVISISGGKGGTGKTTVAVNLAISLARRGKSVMILDADLSLANVDVVLGIKPHRTLNDVLQGRCALEKAIIPGPEGISVIPAASGVEALYNLTQAQRLHLIEEVERVANGYDYLLIDTAAGIGPEVMFLNSAASEVWCIVNPEPTSLTDTYAQIKLLSQQFGEREIGILVNNMPLEGEGAAEPGAAQLRQLGEKTFNCLRRPVERFLQVGLRYLGAVPSDRAAHEAVRQQRALVEIFPSSVAARAFAALAERTDAEFFHRRIKGGMQFFFRQLLEVGAYGE